MPFFSLRRTCFACISNRILLSYVLDVIVILAIFAAGGVLNSLDTYHHHFSLVDPSISFPYQPHETVSTITLMLVSIAAPVLLIILVCWFRVPGTAAAHGTPKSLMWRRKLWEAFTGVLGLGLGLGLAFVLTQMLKDVVGKPRPDLLSRCDPDLQHIKDHIVGGLSNFLAEAPPVVSWTICLNKSKVVSHDGFASFPSGHSSFSFAGMTYLALFLCSKFAIGIPFLPPSPHKLPSPSHFLNPAITRTDNHHNKGTPEDIPPRNQAAAPPIWLLVLPLLCMATAIYIASSRWRDDRHQGFDIICGSILGIASAWLGFRWYHLPVRRGAGWSWGARTRERAFGVKVGMSTYVGEEGWESAKVAPRCEDDLESGRVEAEGLASTSGGEADKTGVETAGQRDAEGLSIV